MKRKRRTKAEMEASKGYDPQKHDAETVLQSILNREEEKEITDSYNKPSEGLGDTVEKVFKATGVDKVAKFILGEDCGCTERKKKLNELFRYTPECLNEDEYEYLKDFYKRKPNTNTSLSQSEQQTMLKIFNRVFRSNWKPSGCADCWRDVYIRLKSLYETY
jgi:hypothetical protein